MHLKKAEWNLEMRPRKLAILIAPAAFKGSLSAKEAAEVMAAFLAARPSAESMTLRVCPIADGGDDTLAVLQAADACYQRYHHSVTGPLPGMRVMADYLAHAGQKTVLIEAAQAHGLKLYPPGSPYQPLQATSYGVGELIAHALKTHQPETLVISLGGSASTDGGMGALQALGFQFKNAGGQALPVPLGGDDLAAVQEIILPQESAFSWQRLLIATDVVNPLLGPTGSAAVYGSQKGASPAQCQQLEAGLQQMDQCMRLGLESRTPQALNSVESDSPSETLAVRPGVGAAGGLAYGLHCLPRAEILSGSQWVAAQLNLPQRVAESDLILTGEGCLDATSLNGKATGHLLALAGDKPVFFFCGQVRDGLTGWGQVAVYPMLPAYAASQSLQAQPPQQTVWTEPKAALRQLLDAAWPRLETLL